jgi:hypothetical protein
MKEESGEKISLLLIFVGAGIREFNTPLERACKGLTTFSLDCFINCEKGIYSLSKFTVLLF